jgi:hypothetical protein
VSQSVSGATVHIQKASEVPARAAVRQIEICGTEAQRHMCETLIRQRLSNLKIDFDLRAADPLSCLPPERRRTVSQLHGLTGCAELDCARALTECDDDAEAAAEKLLLSMPAPDAAPSEDDLALRMAFAASMESSQREFAETEAREEAEAEAFIEAQMASLRDQPAALFAEEDDDELQAAIAESKRLADAPHPPTDDAEDRALADALAASLAMQTHAAGASGGRSELDDEEMMMREAIERSLLWARAEEEARGR